MQSELGSTRALAGFDRRLAGRNRRVRQALKGDLFDRSLVVGEGAKHRTRGRVRSPARLNANMKNTMKYLNPLMSAAAALLLLASLSAQAQQPPGAPPPGQQPGDAGRGGQGRGGFGRGRAGFGPQLPAEQQAEVDRINAALEAEAKAVAAASSNLVVASFSQPVDNEKIAKANQELAKAREAWATKASKLFAEVQATDKKLSPEAIAALIQNASGRGGRGSRGFGPGGPGGPGGERGGRRGGPNSQAQPPRNP